MMQFDLILKSRRVVTPEGVRPAQIFIRDELIVGVEPTSDESASTKTPGTIGTGQIMDVGELVVMPGLIDTQVSCAVPGTDSARGFAVTTRAAAAGGVTTVLEMPHATGDGAATPEALQTRAEAARGVSQVDIGFWAGLHNENIELFSALYSAGALGFQCYLGSGGRAAISPARALDCALLERVFPRLAKLGAPLLCHPELGDAIDRASPVWEHGNPGHYGLYLASRPPGAVSQSVARLAEMAERLGVSFNLVQISAGRALPFLRRARARGVELSAGTCPHYLFFSSDEIKNNQVNYTCAPPIRSRGNRDKLWKALAAGELDFVSSAHIEHAADDASRLAGRFDQAAPGMASIELLLPIMWSVARARGHSIEDLVRWLVTNPARLAGLGEYKGRIAAGMRADLVVWDPDREFIVDARLLQHHHQHSPYHGRSLQGMVHTTLVGGRQVFSRAPGGTFEAVEFGDPCGQLLRSE